METLLVILKILLIGVVTPIGAGLVVWELAQAILGRPLKAPAAAPAETETAEE